MKLKHVRCQALENEVNNRHHNHLPTTRRGRPILLITRINTDRIDRHSPLLVALYRSPLIGKKSFANKSLHGSVQ